MFFAIKSLTRRFGGLIAVADISFMIEKGEIVAIFGPNGSGKTTLLSLIAGLIRPTSGEVRWKSEVISGWKPHRIAAAGIVKTFQNPQLFPELTVVEHILIAAHLPLKRRFGLRRLYTLLRRQEVDPQLARQVSRVLELCRLDAVRDEPAAGLSYGNEKMLGVAMALLCAPELLLLDEPATGLGHDEIKNLDAVLRDLRQDGMTLCIIDHQVRFLGQLANRAIALHHGSKIAEGSPDQVLADPKVAAAYLGRVHA